MKSDSITQNETIKPCGTYHELKCGLDIDCEVKIEHYDDDLTSEEIWNKYKNSN